MTLHVEAVDRTVQKTQDWLAELTKELRTDDASRAWRITKAYLQVLRDRLTASEAAHLAAQLTHLLRGVYYEGYDPDRQPEMIRERDVFLARIAERAGLNDVSEAEEAVPACTRVLKEHITEGEFDDVLAQLPKEIRDMLASA